RHVVLFCDESVSSWCSRLGQYVVLIVVSSHCWWCLEALKYVFVLSPTRGLVLLSAFALFFFFQAEDGIRDATVTGVQTCALPIFFVMWNQVPSISITKIAE